MCASLAKLLDHGGEFMVLQSFRLSRVGIVCADRLQHSDDSGADLDTQRKKSSKSSGVKMKA